MTQLSLFNPPHLTKEIRRKTEKIMGRYRNLNAIIEAKRLDLTTQMTVNYEPSESQRGNGFHSETERQTYVKIDIEEYVLTKKKLDLVFESLKPSQQTIWEQRYLIGRYDTDIYSDLNIPNRTYYRLKKEMILVVAEALGFI